MRQRIIGLAVDDRGAHSHVSGPSPVDVVVIDEGENLQRRLIFFRVFGLERGGNRPHVTVGPGGAGFKQGWEVGDIVVVETHFFLCGLGSVEIDHPSAVDQNTGFTIQKCLLTIGIVQLRISKIRIKKLRDRGNRVLACFSVDRGGAVFGENVGVLLPHQRQNDPHADGKLRKVGGQVILSGCILELLGMGQKLFGRGWENGLAIFHQTGLGHQVHVDMPKVGMDIHRHAVDLAIVCHRVASTIAPVTGIDTDGLQIIADISQRPKLREFSKP